VEPDHQSADRQGQGSVRTPPDTPPCSDSRTCQALLPRAGPRPAPPEGMPVAAPNRTRQPARNEYSHES
jgi:hypothetical protein